VVYEVEHCPLSWLLFLKRNVIALLSWYGPFWNTKDIYLMKFLLATSHTKINPLLEGSSIFLFLSCLNLMWRRLILLYYAFATDANERIMLIVFLSLIILFISQKRCWNVAAAGCYYVQTGKQLRTFWKILLPL
jgi:hypothetical protein